VGALLAELEQLGSLKETLVVLTSDHGDEFFEHGRKGHGKSLYDEVLHVPLIIRLPSGPNGLVFDELASTLDIAPTILDYLGFGVPRSMQGRSLVPSSEEDTGWADRLTFSRLKERSAGARSSRFKLVQSFNPVRQEFYDLTADPGEHENLVGRARGSTRTALRAHRFELLRWLREQRAIHDSMGIARGAEISESLRQELEALGYID
jgi:arylsulfatase A-like enzyme